LQYAIIGTPKKIFKNGPVLYVDLKLTIHVIKSQIHVVRQFLLKDAVIFSCRLFFGRLSCDVRMRSMMSGCCGVSGAGTSSRAPSTRRRHRSSAPSWSGAERSRWPGTHCNRKSNLCIPWKRNCAAAVPIHKFIQFNKFFIGFSIQVTYGCSKQLTKSRDFCHYDLCEFHFRNETELGLMDYNDDTHNFAALCRGEEMRAGGTGNPTDSTWGISTSICTFYGAVFLILL
jgi:hypothetical protein